MLWDQHPSTLTFEKLLQTALEFEKEFADIVTAWHMHPDTLKRFNEILGGHPQIKKIDSTQQLPFGLMGGLNLIPDDSIPQGWRYEYSGKRVVKGVDMRKGMQ